MLVFYIAFMLIGLLGIFFFGGDPVICGVLLGISFMGGILALFARGKIRGISLLLIPACGGLCLFMGQAAGEDGMKSYEEMLKKAAVQIEKGKLEEGEALLNELEANFGVTDLSRYVRAELSLGMGEYDTALSLIKRVENQADGRWYEAMGTVLSLLDTAESLASLEELYLSGAEKLPDNGRLQYMAGLVQLSRGNRQEAAYFFRRAKDLGEEEGLSCYYMGLIKYELGDWSSAKEYFEEALQQGVEQEKEENIRWYMERQGA